MCGEPEQQSGNSPSNTCENVLSNSQGSTTHNSMEVLNEQEGDPISELLELAAENDLEGFKEAIKDDKARTFGFGSWYSRKSGTTRMVLEQRNPAMIASLYGSVDVLKYILGLCDSYGQINMACGSDGSTALHCAAAGGSLRAIETVKLLLEHGADLNVVDAQGRRPADVIASFPRLKHVKETLEIILEVASEATIFPRIDIFERLECDEPFQSLDFNRSSVVGDDDVLPVAISSSSGTSSQSPSSSPRESDKCTAKEGNEKSREYPIDPSIPDIKNSMYTTDEFRMFSFKIRPCSRAYSHDWTECPFVHPGENARRRDPRRYHYSCVPCPDFRKGSCRRGDACEYAHGVFECWLHPAQYRTRLCKDGTDCARRVCFFAHKTHELRPLYVSSGSSITSPRDVTTMSPPPGPGSPSSSLMMSSFSLSNNAVVQVNHGTTPCLSPSSSPANSLSGAWSSSSNLPPLHLPGMSLHASRLRSALNARDLSLDDLGRMSEFDGQILSETSSISSQALSTQARLNAAIAASASGTSSSRVGQYKGLEVSVSPTNLEDIFASEMVSSPQSTMHDSLMIETQMKPSSQAFMSISDQMQIQMQRQTALESLVQGSPKHYTATQTLGLSEFNLQCPPNLYPSTQTLTLSEPNLQGSPRQYSLTQSPSYNLGSLGRMSSFGGLDVDKKTSNGGALKPGLLAVQASFSQGDKKSHSSRELGANSPLCGWGSPTGKLEWGMQREDLSRFKKSSSFDLRERQEEAWVETIVKEESGINASVSEDCASSRDADLSVLGSWMENMHLDQIVA